MKFFDDAKLKFVVWSRERKERAEEKRAQRRAMEYGFDRTPARIRFAVQLATYGVIGFLLLWITQMTGVLQLDLALDWAVDRPLALDWDLQLDLNILPLIVLAIVSFAIVFWSKAWVSLFASTPWREWFSKWGSLVLGIGGSLAIIMGGFEVNQHTREEDYRGALVQEQGAQQSRAAIQSQIDQITADLNTAMNNRNAYLAQAASVGAMGGDWRASYVEQARRTNDPRLPMLERAQGAADAAADMVSRRNALRTQLAEATPVAATAATVEMSDPVSQFIGSIGAWRIVVLVLVGDLILLLGNYFADKAEERRRYATSVQASGWADEGHRIEDLRAEEPIVPQPMKPAREVVTDAETGEELVKVKPREYWRRAKGKRQKLDIQPEIPPDETGVATDGGKRTAVTIGGAMEVESAGTSHDGGGDAASADQGDNSGDPDFGGREEEHAVKHEDGEEGPREDNYDAEPIDHPNLSQADEPAVDALEMELEAASEEVDVEDDSNNTEREADDADDQQIHHEPQERTEPETRNSHMLPNVAAE